MDPTSRRMPQIEGLLSYVQSMDWTEPWLYGLIAFYGLLFGGLYVFRRNSSIQSFSFVFMLVTVYMAEDLNQYFAHNHRMFTKHQYFDSTGLFISIIMSGPLLLACVFIVANWFYMSSQLMAEVKILQLKRRQRHRQQSTAAADATENPETPESTSRESSQTKRRKRVKKEE